MLSKKGLVGLVLLSAVGCSKLSGNDKLEQNIDRTKVGERKIQFKDFLIDVRYTLNNLQVTWYEKGEGLLISKQQFVWAKMPVCCILVDKKKDCDCSKEKYQPINERYCGEKVQIGGLFNDDVNIMLYDYDCDDKVDYLLNLNTNEAMWLNDKSQFFSPKASYNIREEANKLFKKKKEQLNKYLDLDKEFKSWKEYVKNKRDKGPLGDLIGKDM